MNDTLDSSEKQPKERNGIGEHPPSHQPGSGLAWYLVHCKPNGEQMALRNLKNLNFPTFLPLQNITRRKGTTFQTKLRPLFPGYIFVAQDPAAGQWRKINNTRGVARLVRLGTEPTPVPPTIMKQLFVRCDATGVFQQRAGLYVGDNAEITQGPLAGAIGKIIEIDANQRIYLLLDFMGQKSTLKIASMDVTSTV